MKQDLPATVGNRKRVVSTKKPAALVDSKESNKPTTAVISKIAVTPVQKGISFASKLSGNSAVVTTSSVTTTSTVTSSGNVVSSSTSTTTVTTTTTAPQSTKQVSKKPRIEPTPIEVDSTSSSSGVATSSSASESIFLKPESLKVFQWGNKGSSINTSSASVVSPVPETPSVVAQPLSVQEEQVAPVSEAPAVAAPAPVVVGNAPWARVVRTSSISAASASSPVDLDVSMSLSTSGTPKEKEPIEELTAARIEKRQAQIDLGKRTESYQRYLEAVPLTQRKPRYAMHPVTPDVHAPVSKRNFDGLVRAWRTRLHAWDPVKPVSDSAAPIALSSNRSLKPPTVEEEDKNELEETPVEEQVSELPKSVARPRRSSATPFNTPAHASL
jgi:Histone RNA hairpin-binding protein RNA-binding domain